MVALRRSLAPFPPELHPVNSGGVFFLGDVRRRSPMRGQPPRTDRLQHRQATEPCRDGKGGEPDPLRPFLVGEKRRGAEAQQRRRGGSENDPGQHLGSPIDREHPALAARKILCRRSHAVHSRREPAAAVTVLPA